MSKISIAKILGVTVVVVLIFAFIATLFIFAEFRKEGTRTAQIEFEISQGQGVKSIAQELENKGIITSPNLFVAAVTVKGHASDLQAGSYIIPANASIDKIIDLFISGAVEDVVTVRIPEESTSAQIAEFLEREGVVTARDFLSVVNVTDTRELFSSEVKFPALDDKPDTAGLEGYLYPDTYELYNDATAEDIVFKMLATFEKRLTEEDRDAIKAQGKTIFEIVTMASIVEKEEPNPKEKATVAGVFWNRIAIGMPLQSDATVNYVTEADNPQPTLEELQTESPYNTYLHAGLPPGPISNPTIASIRAAIYPEETDYYYFLHPQDGSGRTIYSQTAADHSQNKMLYLE